LPAWQRADGAAFQILLACLQTLCPQVLFKREGAEKQNAPT
jgi:GntR family transcriptional regulator/MocR family aminotransferase